MEHLKVDLGTLTKGSTVVVTLDKQANVLLMDASNYRIYASGRGGQFRYYGGLMKRSPARIPVPRTGHWYLATDLGGARGQVRQSVSVQPPPRGNLPVFREPAQQLAGKLAVREPQTPLSADFMDGRTWDLFLSHASEDKVAVALPLAAALHERGVTVWLDKAELRIGDSLRRRIDQGLRSSRSAAVVLSPAYFTKGWPQYELDGIVGLSVSGSQSMLPIWHGVEYADVAAQSPSLADKFALRTAVVSIDEIADQIADLISSSRDA